MPAVATGRVAARRNMGGHDHAQAVADTEFWRKASIGGGAVVATFATIIGYIELTHEHHHHEKPKYSYLKIRTKPYPWSCPDCNFFDSACWRECKAARE